MYYYNGKGALYSVLCRKVVPFLEGPLSEVPLYSWLTWNILHFRSSSNPSTIGTVTYITLHPGANKSQTAKNFTPPARSHDCVCVFVLHIN